MAIVLEAPEQLEATRPAALHVEPPAAIAAANLLEGDVTEGEPQREGSTSVTIRLVKAVEQGLHSSSHLGLSPIITHTVGVTVAALDGLLRRAAGVILLPVSRLGEHGAFQRLQQG